MYTNSILGKTDPSTVTTKRSPDDGADGEDGPTDSKKSRCVLTNNEASIGRGFFSAQMLPTNDQVRIKARDMIQSALESGSMLFLVI